MTGLSCLPFVVVCNSVNAADGMHCRVQSKQEEVRTPKVPWQLDAEAPQVGGPHTRSAVDAETCTCTVGDEEKTTTRRMQLRAGHRWFAAPTPHMHKYISSADGVWLRRPIASLLTVIAHPSYMNGRESETEREGCNGE